MADAAARTGPVVVLLDHFLELSETFVASEAHALQRLGVDVRVIANVRAVSGNPDDAEGLAVAFREDEGFGEKLLALAQLVARHPIRCLRDLRDRRRWGRQEYVRRLAALAPNALRLEREGIAHIHVHFAVGAALDGLRLHRLTGIPYSLTAHAFDIFQRPENLVEKIENAEFVTSGCDYNVDYLRKIAPAAAGRIHKIVMGIDGEKFRRRAPFPGGRAVIAIGRLIEKKGFDDLVEAARLLAADGAVERVVIVGEGSQRAELEAQVAAGGLEGVVELPGARSPEQIRTELERADVLAMPCVVAANGDRDSMPVVVKEALAMEIPVVGTDEVGLPEVIRPEWGRLVPPHDPQALAGALRELLGLDPQARAGMGRAGREFVLRECDVATETRKLANLIAAVTVS